MEQERSNKPTDPAATTVGYTFVRHIGFILDELSDQGLDLWRDGRGSWHWRWRTMPLQWERGFWAFGEALLDAVITRWPAAFDCGEGSQT